MNTLKTTKIWGFQVNLKVRECSRRILDLCKDRDLLRKERTEAKSIRGKIVGVGNTMEGFGDRYSTPSMDMRPDVSGYSRNKKRQNSDEDQPYDPFRPTRKYIK